MKQKNPFIIVLLAASLWLMLDVASKQWALASGIYVTHNTGIAFGLPIPMMVQIIGSLVIMGALIFMAGKTFFTTGKNTLAKAVLLGMVLGGAAGNLLDRLIQGYVVDFIVLRPIPVFNVADIGITLGLTVLFLLSFKPSS